MHPGAEKISFLGELVAAGANAGARRSGIVASLGLDFATEATARTALQRVRETDYAVIFLTGTNDDPACGFRGCETGDADYLVKSWYRKS